MVSLLVASTPCESQDERPGRIEVISGADLQTVLAVYNGSEAGDEFGAAAGSDTLPGGSPAPERDWLVGAPGAQTSSGRVWAVRARDGQRLFSVDGDLLGGELERFGHQVAALGHVDGRQFTDWAIAAPASVDSEAAPTVVALTDVGGALGEAYRLEGPPGSLFGWRVINLFEDLDGDGNFEFLVTSPRESNGNKSAAGALRIFSSKTGRRLYTVRGEEAGDNLGYSVGPVRDQDGDGARDLLVGAPGDGSKDRPGHVVILSSRNGAVLGRLNAPAKALHFGFALRLILADLDGDGREDWIVGAPGYRKARGAAYAISSSSLEPLQRIRGRRKNQQLGVGFKGLAVNRDLDGDGLNEVNVNSLLAKPKQPLKDQLGRTAIYSLGARSVLQSRDGKESFDRLGDGGTGSAADFDGDGSFDPLLAIPARPLAYVPAQ